MVHGKLHFYAFMVVRRRRRMITDYKLKLLLCGSASSGKTRVIKRHVKNAFQSEYKLTIGVDILTKDVTLSNGELATLSIWDIGGQSRFEFIRKTFYKGASGVIIVVNLDNPWEWEDSQKWASEIHEKIGDIPVIVVGHAISLEKDDLEYAHNESLVRNEVEGMNYDYCSEEAFDYKITDFTEQLVGLKKHEVRARTATGSNEIPASFMKPAEIDEDDAASWFNKGIANVSQKDYPAAIESMRKACALDPGWATPWHFLACFYNHGEEQDQAMACCMKALEIDPNLSVAWNVEAAIHMKKGEVDSAILCSKQALEIDPGLFNAWNTLGRAYIEKGMDEEAAHCFNRSLAIEPAQADIWYGLGLLNARKPDLEEARRCLAKAIEVNPSHEQTIQASRDVKMRLERQAPLPRSSTRMLARPSTSQPAIPGFAAPFFPYDGPEPFMFVSHAVVDSPRVYDIIKYLNHEGIRIWFDQGGPAGEHWWDMIAGKIQHCSNFMVFLSSAAIMQETIFSEIALARRRYNKQEIRIIPVYLETVELTSRFSLAFGNIPSVDDRNCTERQFLEKVMRSIIDAALLGRKAPRR